MRNLVASILALAGAACLPAAASAATITTADLMACSGLSSCAVGGATISGAPGKLQGKTVAGQFGLGVAGKTFGEIDHGERLTVDFGRNVYLNAFTLAFLYNGLEFGDFREKGRVSAVLANGSTRNFRFRARSENTATISSGLGTVTNCGATTLSGSGCFSFAGRPLGDHLIRAISFTAPNRPTIFGNNSDFALAGIDYSEVPVPGAALLLLTGLGAFGVSKRRRRTA